MRPKVRFWLAFGLAALSCRPASVAAAVVITNSTNVSLANSRIEIGPDTSDNPSVVNDLVGALIFYNASSQFGFLSATYGVQNLNDGDIGAGVTSDGTYAIPLEKGDGTGGKLTLTFAGSTTIGSIAIYNGYGNRDDGNYLILDAQSNTLGGFSISGTGGLTNNGVDSFWITFNEPVITTNLNIHFDVSSTDNHTASFREIQVFGVSVVPEPSSLVLTALGTLGFVGFHLSRQQSRNALRSEKKAGSGG